MVIYKITNKINGKPYVGQTTKPIELRWKQHCQTNRKRTCPLFSRAIKKYGPENFSIDIIANYNNQEDLNNAEEYFIDFYNSLSPNGYNLDSGGKGHGKVHEETKKKISKTLTGRPNGKKGIPTNHTPWNKGKPWSDEMRKKLSDSHIGQISWCKGKKLTKKHIKNLRKAKIGKPNKLNMKPIICINTGKKYESARSAAKDLKLQPSKICLVLKGIRPHTGGFQFKYLEANEAEI